MADKAQADKATQDTTKPAPKRRGRKPATETPKAAQALQELLAGQTKTDGKKKGGRKPAEPKPETPAEPKVMLRDMETDIIRQLAERMNGGEKEIDLIAEAIKIGDPIVKADRLAYYRGERWDNGRWLSKAVAKNIKAGVAKLVTKVEEPKEAPKPEEPEVSREDDSEKPASPEVLADVVELQAKQEEKAEQPA